MTPNECNNLDKLFEAWRDHDLPKGWVIPCENKERFYPDGFVKQNEFGGKKILFILIEPHVECKKKMKPPQTCEECQHDWFANCILGGKIEEMSFKLGRPYFDKTLKMKQTIDGIDNGENDFASLREVAFMNVNKTGGGGNSSKRRILEDYVNHYRPFIQREIELINPEIIVCCGLVLKGLLKNILDSYVENNDDRKIRVVYMLHPARIGVDKYKRIFQKLWESDCDTAGYFLLKTADKT